MELFTDSVMDYGSFTSSPTVITQVQKPVIVPALLTSEDALLPAERKEDDAGIDLRSSAEYDIEPGKLAAISTGLALELPKNYCAIVLGRSGLAFNTNILAIHTGLIDTSYRGEIKVLLLNFGNETFHISIGDRIAQLLVLPYLPTQLNQVASLSESHRGTQGFGSSGIA